MTSQGASSGGQGNDLPGSAAEPPPFDISVAHPARIYNYWAGFLDGLELVDPGLVPLPQWRALASPAHVIPCYAAVARKP